MTDKMVSQLKFAITHFALTATNMDETNEIRPRLSLKHTEIVTGLYTSLEIFRPLCTYYQLLLIPWYNHKYCFVTNVDFLMWSTSLFRFSTNWVV